MTAAVPPPPGAARRRLSFAAAGVLLGAADTYVVVTVLPSIMAAVGIGLDQLQRATPIISGFLLGYVAVMPLLGRLSDLFGRTSVITMCLLLFAGGSLITASADSLGAVVAGRALQGLGGGGLVPVTLAMVADLWPANQRGLPLGAVGAAQEMGSVVGPLYGAALTAASTWRAIFYINVPLAALVGAGVHGRTTRHANGALHLDGAGIVLALACAAATVLAVVAPAALTDSVSLGSLYVPLAAQLPITSPIAVVAVVSALLLLLRELTLPSNTRPLLPVRRITEVVARSDWIGAVLIAGVLAIVVVVFATADPQTQVLSDAATILLPIAATLASLFVVRQLRSSHPLVDLRGLRDRAAAGALLTNLAVGAALIAALVDVPIFARSTVDSTSQVAASLVLGRLLIALPVGAVIGGLLVQRAGYRAVVAAGMGLSAGMFLLMTRWSSTSMADSWLGASWLHPSDPILVACGLGFGLSIAPVNAAILGAVRSTLHGIAAALTVVARMVGMLVGLSVLTGLGLHRFYAIQATLPRAVTLCPDSPVHCPAYDALERTAIVDELHLVFLAAAVCAALAAVIGGTLLRRREDRASALGAVLAGAG